jgi:hypothetical protein
MNQLLLLTKNNITETMSYSNWKKEISLYLTNYINSLELKLKKELKHNETHIWNISCFSVIKRDPYMEHLHDDVIESKVKLNSNNLEKRIERNVSRHSLSSNKPQRESRSCIT